MSTKDAVVAQLLQASAQQVVSSKCIVELDSLENDEEPEAISSAATLATITDAIETNKVDDNQPSILDEMIAAQREAMLQTSSKSGAGSTSNTGLGFKKGFLSSSKKSEARVSTTQSAVKPVVQSRNDAIIDLKKPAPSKTDNALVLEDVQKALAEDEHPMLKALKQNDWITPDLATKIRSNDVLSRGLSDPRCMVAIQLLQKNPQQAMQQFQNDPVVSVFLKEFASIMASHFESMGGSIDAGQSTSKSEPTSQSRAPLVQVMPEIGPLHSKVLSDAESYRQRSKNSTTAGGHKDEERVQKVRRIPHQQPAPLLTCTPTPLHQILQDEELRSMLMDPALQQILLECGDPAQFQRHMRDPETARKIVRLQQAGLVGTAK